MNSRPGISSFPSMTAFMGENPSKRKRIVEPPISKPSTSSGVTEVEMEDEVWEELDDTAVDEIFTLATQMTAQVPYDNVNETKEDHSTDYFMDKNSNVHGNSKTSAQNNKSSLDDIPSTSASDFHNSHVFRNHVKNKSASVSVNRSLKNNAYSSRFNDFAALQSSPSKLSPIPRSHSSGKVYNSIPMKGSAMSGNSQGMSVVKDQLNSVSHNKEAVSKTENDLSKLSEELQVKQGEIALLRAELRRREVALEAERLDRCTAIDAAEKRGREKAAALVLEAETKVKEYDRKVEKLQGEIHFKNREVQELETQCRRLEKQVQDQCLSQLSEKRCPTKRSPIKPSSTFKERFDFSGRITNSKSVEIQTEKHAEERRQTHKLSVSCPRGKISGSRQMTYLFSLDKKNSCSASESHSSKWTLDDHWSNLFSRIGGSYPNEYIQVQILSYSIECLEESHILLTSLKTDAVQPSVSGLTTVAEKYEGRVVPALSVIKTLTLLSRESDLEKALLAVCSHLPVLSIKEVTVSNRIWPLVLQAIKHLARVTPSQLDRAVCQSLLQSLEEACCHVTSSAELAHLLRALEALVHHKYFLSSLCTGEGNCFVSKLFSVIRRVQEEYIAYILQDCLAAIVYASPEWLYSECYCSAKMLATYLTKLHVTLELAASKNKEKQSECNKLLLSAIRLLHCWSNCDDLWWEKVAHLPHYTAVMGAVIDRAKDIGIDRPTVDLLCDLYEFDEKIFEGF
ncbi:hypothetical protein SK128_011908 [Halocaridina rubra]|uniref:ATR-interacting protein n=1 Tax=Halocaridina rubra TaxID=373956 RepID=A0AAN8X5C5_HALRR